MRKHVNNKRGISSIVSTLLMILVVMVGMGLLFAYLTTYVANYQIGSGSSVLESMTVEDVWFKNSNLVEIWVYNVGKVGFTITSIYVNATPPRSFTVNSNSEPSVVPVGGHADVLITLSQPWSNGVAYSFKIVTSRGSAFSETHSPLS
jgi:flagellin-like protein